MSQPHRFSAANILARVWNHTKLVAQSLVMAWKRWKMDDGTMMAAAVSYYLALSIFPALLLLTSGLGLFLKYTHLGQDAEVQILGIVAEHCSPSLKSQIEALLQQLEDQSLATGPLGLLVAVMTAIGVFYQFERSFDKIWRIPAPVNDGLFRSAIRILTKRLVAFVLLACVGLGVAGILIINVLLGAVREWMAHLNLPGTVSIGIVDSCTTMLLNSLAFGLIYRYLPKRRVYWRDAFRAGLLVSIIWEFGREFLCSVLIGMRYTAAYGAIGSFIALLLWFYWGVTILFFGAEYLQVISRYRRRPFSLFGEKPTEAESDTAMETRERIQPRRSL